MRCVSGSAESVPAAVLTPQQLSTQKKREGTFVDAHTKRPARRLGGRARRRAAARESDRNTRPRPRIAALSTSYPGAGLFSRRSGVRFHVELYSVVYRSYLEDTIYKIRLDTCVVSSILQYGVDTRRIYVDMEKGVVSPARGLTK